MVYIFFVDNAPFAFVHTRILYAIGLLSEYIDEKTSEQLQKTYGLDGAAVAASAGAAAAVKAPPKSDYTAPAS